MTVLANVETFETRLWEGKDLSAIKEYVLESTEIISPVTRTPGFEGMRELVEGWLEALPDLTCIFDARICQKNKAVTCIEMAGTHLGHFLGCPPTGKSVTFSGLVLYEWEADKITRYQMHVDIAGMMQQLGVTLVALPESKQE
ncbi:MAG: hypothetical protein EBX40_02165 [Gammaproteobacteria bacterium]|nr:hypothetical protein [Gammaproteobacteria bacterium]